MARISEDELTQLKDTISLQRLAEAKGITLKRHGADLIGLCPFHDDHEPSLVISPDKNLWHCLGACQCGGTVIDWVMKSEGVSFRHAVELLRADPSLVASSSPPVKRSTVTRLPAPITVDAEDQVLLQQVVHYYHRALLQNTEALAYLAKRGIASREAIELMQLGFADRSLGYHLPHKNRQEGAEMRGRLQRLGILRASGHEHFNGSLVIPVINDDLVTEMYGRKITDGLRPGTPLHLYLPGPHRGVWNQGALFASREIILCESLIDALTFWCAGYRNVTASYGVEGFTPDHLRALKENDTERVLIAYDRDAAGDSAAQALAKTLMAEGIDCYRIQFPKGMDANEYALRVTPATKSLGLTIRKAVWLGKGKAPALTTEAVTPTLDVNEPSAVDYANSASAARDAELKPSLAADSAGTELEPFVLPASVLPQAVAEDMPTEVSNGGVLITLGERRYRVRGLNKNLALDVVLKVNVMVSGGDAFHVDTFDLYAPRAKHAFIVQAAVELAVKEDIIRHDLGRVLRKLESLQEQNVQQTLAPKPDAATTLNESERNDALALLKEPKLLERILADFARCGVVGEETNKLVAYLAATSRKLDSPLAIMVQSSSAAGKSSLMEAVLALMPEEDKVQYSAMTGQALFYMGAINLQHKILALAEEAGAARASYALKLLQSEGVLKIASTGKNPETGELVTQEYTVEGPVMIFSTTTAIDHDEELMNRCLTLGVDESREQTRAIHTLQRQKRTLDGLFAKKAKQRIVAQHQNAQRLLRPLAVRNPYADSLTFPDERTRLRRDHEKYLTLIDTIALLHQYQRPIKTTVYDGETFEYVEVTCDDIEVATRLAHETLGRSLDELHPQTRRLLLLLDTHVRETCATRALVRTDYRFSRRDVREHTGWSDTQLRLHLDRLVALEYLLVPRGGRGQSFVYELLYDGQGKDGSPFVPGLIDSATLRAVTTTTPSTRGSAGEFAGSTRGDSGPNTVGSRGSKNHKNAFQQSTERTLSDAALKNALLGETTAPASYAHDVS